MSQPASRDPVELLAEASSHVFEVHGREPWNFGWRVEEYRRSDRAAFGHNGQTFKLTESGLPLYEEAVRTLLRRPAVQARWDKEETWSLVASLLFGSCDQPDPRLAIRAAIERLSSVGPSLVAFPVANVAWAGKPMTVANCGRLTDDFVKMISRVAGNRPSFSLKRGNEWIEQQRSLYSQEPVVFVSWCPGQKKLGYEQAQRQFETLINVSLLLEAKLYEFGLFSLRGNSHRPGVRGLTIDRRALMEADQRLRAELASSPLIASNRFDETPVHWYGGEPFPLDKLLRQRNRTSVVAKCLTEDSAVPRRIRVAGRWYAEAHWAFENDDAALALGVALDALIGSRSGLPGRAMSERYGLLEQDPQQRRVRAATYNERFRVRSSVAHGGRSSALDEGDFVREFAQDICWCAQRLLLLESNFGPLDEDGLDSLFDDLRWGIRAW